MYRQARRKTTALLLPKHSSSTSSNSGWQHKYIDGETGWCCMLGTKGCGVPHMVLETFGGMEIYKQIGG